MIILSELSPLSVLSGHHRSFSRDSIGTKVLKRPRLVCGVLAIRTSYVSPESWPCPPPLQLPLRLPFTAQTLAFLRLSGMFCLSLRLLLQQPLQTSSFGPERSLILTKRPRADKTMPMPPRRTPLVMFGRLVPLSEGTVNPFSSRARARHYNEPETTATARCAIV